MPDNRLELIAELIDKVSPQAKKMQRAFEDLQKTTEKNLPQAFKRYQSAVVANEKALTEYGKKTISIGRELTAFQNIIKRTSPAVAGLTDAFGAFSVGAGTAIGGIVAIGAAMLVAGKSAANFAEQIKELKFGSEASGFGLTQLKQMQLALERFNISQEDTAKSSIAFNSAVTEMARNTGMFIRTFEDMRGGAALAQPLIEMAKAGKPAAEIMTKLFDISEEIGKKFGPDVQRRFLSHFNLGPEFARVKDIHGAIGDVKKYGFDPETLGKAAKDAETLNLELDRGRIILDGLGVAMNANMLEKLVKAIELAERLGKILSPSIGGFFNWYRDKMLQNHPELGGGSATGGFGEGAGVPGAGTPIAYHPGGGGGGGGGAPGLGSGGGFTMGPQAGGDMPGSAPGAASRPGGGSVGGGGGGMSGAAIPPGTAGAGVPFAASGGGGAAYVAARREPFRQELEAHPETRELLAGIISAENPGAGPAVAESLMNRTELVNQHRAQQGLPPLTLRDMIRGHPSIGGGRSFYGPMRTGAINAHLARVRGNPQYRAQMNQRIDRALEGSFTTEGYTDQGSAGDPNYASGGVGVNINRERFNNWGYPGSRAFHDEYLRQYREHAAAATHQDRVNMQAGMNGVSSTRVDTSGEMHLRVHAPPGTSVRTQGFFKKMQLHRAIQMPQTNPGPEQGTPFA